MAIIPEEKLQELKDRIDIVDLVGRYVGLKRSGKNFTACCPFHSERTPSFYVNPERRSYKCFGCGVWGSGIDFIMQLEGKGFLEATRQLAQQYGVQLPAGLKDTTSTAQQVERDEAYAITRSAAELYREILLTGEDGHSGASINKNEASPPRQPRPSNSAMPPPQPRPAGTASPATSNARASASLVGRSASDPGAAARRPVQTYSPCLANGNHQAEKEKREIDRRSQRQRVCGTHRSATGGRGPEADGYGADGDLQPVD